MLSSRWPKLAPYVFISPFFIIFLVFGAFPIAFSGAVSLIDWQGVTMGKFLGFQNYINLFRDRDFLRAVLNTVYLLALSGPLTIGGGLVLAVLLNSQLLRLRGLFRTVFYLPMAVSLVVAGLAFSMVLNKPFGVVNDVIVKQLLNLEPVDFLTNPSLAIPTLTLVIMWRYIGNDLVIMLAGLQSISPDLYEASRIDGASPFQTFIYITLPQMVPIILFDAILSTVNTFNMFAEPYIIFGTEGGVNQSALITGLLVYRVSFKFFKFGYGAAMAYLIGVVIFALSLLQLRLGRRD
jgi:lactose/L-arabinose transport system permease protein